jgi:hypothetical protein
MGLSSCSFLWSERHFARNADYILHLAMRRIVGLPELGTGTGKVRSHAWAVGTVGVLCARTRVATVTAARVQQPGPPGPASEQKDAFIALSLG